MVNLRDLIALRAEKLLSKVPLKLAETISAISPMIPCYHVVAEGYLPHVRHLFSYKNMRQFEDDLDFFCSRYRPLSLADIIENIHGDGRGTKKGFLLTFDDGYSQMHSVVAPILLKRGLPALFFICPDFVDNRALSYRNKASLLIDHVLHHQRDFARILPELPDFFKVPLKDLPRRILSVRYKDAQILDHIAAFLGLDFGEYLLSNKPFLSSEQIDDLIDMGFAIGAHSMNHPLFAGLSLEEQIDQALSSLQFVKRRFKTPYSLFAFPHSDHSVTKAFFHSIKDHVDLTFGTRGPKDDTILTNLQRINFEKTLEPARDIVARELIRKGIQRVLRKSTISRT